MKKFFMTAVVALAFVAAPSVNAQDFNVDKSPMDQAAFPSNYKESNKLVKVTYSRPQLKERELSKLAPDGKVWRLGANEAAEITLYKDMKLGTTPVKAGTYTMYAMPNGAEWTIILSSDLNVWGSYFYKEANDVARITVPVTQADDAIEYFGMEFMPVDQGAHLHMAWGNARVEVPFYN
ncbi:Protein of unknown function (DUF2911) [Dokdonia sp. Hel_I_63]|jgi:hypothetical protein|uniref:DUF2911 domain-containing protein n=1 Tax=unclassified Dokdonia TaxID=2615033 RepID=UPI00020A750E|nr:MULTISPECIES: DUF2911 domain-containing protein [unclassified Dokdonia]AEE19786.1 asparagine synthetase B [Dokdonia sp. 4H-3-7-5]TVZ23996.1 Protein of unknown function (DUF2911) [Dokdonia sp. Hel_I_63]